jgi:hypothetical protein
MNESIIIYGALFCSKFDWIQCIVHFILHLEDSIHEKPWVCTLLQDAIQCTGREEGGSKPGPVTSKLYALGLVFWISTLTFLSGERYRVIFGIPQ